MKNLSLVLLLFTMILMSGFIQAQEKKDTPEYLIMVADIEHPEVLGSSKVYISINGQEYIEKKFGNKDTEGKFDFNPLINLILEYNARGWETMATNMSSGYNKSSEKEYLFIMMKREKHYKIIPEPKDTIFKK
jgi:hypothetical protein